jgi:hypothetical protein
MANLSGQGINREGANCHCISSFLCNFSYEYDTVIVLEKKLGLIQLKELAHELLMSKVFTLTLL